MGKIKTQDLTWREYVLRVAGDDRQADIARRTKIDQATISRWLRDDDHKPSSAKVQSFAAAYGVSVIEAFVVADLMSPEEAGMEKPSTIDLSSVSDDDLLAEVKRRFRRPPRPRRRPAG